ncbi:MAG: HD domain-containing phosphohydrolase [Planctomycetota bacterium]|jgi:HD-GYP domain-containing protein (c-di-GMP phosphodiesterase class II)
MSNPTGKNLSVSENRAVSGKRLDPAQVRRLKRFGDRIGTFGSDFAVFDTAGELVLFCEGGSHTDRREQLTEYAQAVLNNSDPSSRSGPHSCVLRFGEGNSVLAALLKTGGDAVAAALIDLGKSPGVDDNQGLKDFCREQRIDSDVLTELLSDSVRPDCDYLAEMLEMFIDGFGAVQEAAEQIEMVSTELAQTYEELVLLHKLSTNMKITESDANYLQMACDSLTDIVSVGGIAVLLEKTVDDEKKWVVTAGSGLIDIDENLAVVLQNRLAEAINNGKEALLDSEVDKPFKYEWPSNIDSIIAAPLHGKDRTGPSLTDGSLIADSIMGFMVAINRMDKPDFDSTDVKLFNSVANGCAVFVENGRLFQDLKELFVGSLKALTNSIDAKDQYTRGHSERVAFISRWIAEKLAGREPLEEEQIHRVYLAGLLHDIGKMGIDEALLRKKGKLTEEEMNHIRAHPPIGAGILAEIKQMRDIVPGVLCHHERIDGKGYPSGLVGGQIPLIGKIVGLADGFDAMTSKRVYRDALTVEQAIAEVERGLGTQFDENVGRVFLESDVYQLWDAIQDGSEFIGMSGKSNFSEYGTVAVGTLIR